MVIRGVCFALIVAGLSACTTTSGQGNTHTNRRSEVFSSDLYKNKGYKELFYKASGKTYTLFVLQKAKGNWGMDKIHTYVSKGTPFTGTSADDVEVQNMVRDAYRALKLCPANLHPGITNFAYGPVMVGGVPMWNVYLRCTEKVQSNV